MKKRQGFIRQSYGGFIRQTDGGFTLIELLVVIGVIAILLAVLMLALQRAKRQARAVACQANLRQWGLIISTYSQDNDGRFWELQSNPSQLWFNVLDAWRYEDLCFCPMAVKVNPDPERNYADGTVFGNKFTAWQLVDSGRSDGKAARGSYGLNGWVADTRYSPRPDTTWYWKTCYVERPATVPVFADCINFAIGPQDVDKPPAYEDELLAYLGFCAINRHNGGINILFMDWSARKTGLKELWTLKWHREFDTINCWTTAGGVKPTDWPEWMRKFKDY